MANFMDFEWVWLLVFLPPIILTCCGCICITILVIIKQCECFDDGRTWPQQEKRGSKVSLVAAEPQAWMVDVEAGGSGSGESSAKLSKSENDTGIKNEDKFSETLVVQTGCDDDSPKDIGSPGNSESVNNSIGVDNSAMNTTGGVGGNIDDVKNESLPC